MSVFTRAEHRFDCRGLSLSAAPDAVPEGKFYFLQNVRSYVDGTLQARLGLVAVTNATFSGAVVHSLGRLNDPTSYAGATQFKFFGASTILYAGATTFPSVDTGYSGNPLTLVPITPIRSPEPWMYVADKNKTRKVDVNGHVVPVGLPMPTTEPTAILPAKFANVMDDFSGPFFPWGNAGTAASGSGTATRVSTTIAQILYDVGTSGYASIAPVDMSNLSPGVLLLVNATDTIGIDQVTLAVASTTIAAIVYDSGTTGACTIQPTGSLGTGQLEGPSWAEYIARAVSLAGNLGTAGQGVNPEHVSSSTVPRQRQLDFPVNCLITLSGPSETVRIASVAVGRDGVLSFRCVTTGTHHAADTIVGVPAFRAFCSATYTAGTTLADTALTNTITPALPVSGNPPATATAGIKTAALAFWGNHNLSQINGRATLPDDDVHLSVRLSDCTVVQTIRVYFDVDAVTNDFTQNYYFFEWRANDILAAIQNINTASVLPIQTAQATVAANIQIGQQIIAPFPLFGPSGAPATPGPGTATNADSNQLSLGNNQWLELRCKISDLVRVGTDSSRSLANVGGAEILIDVSSPTTAPITVAYDALWISGGFGPDISPLGIPYTYWYRYRSSLTGAIGNPSPRLRATVAPQRQRVMLSGTQCPDTVQCDLVDWFRQGGTLTTATYCGTSVNTNPPTLNDDVADASITAGETLEVDNFQPWPITDLPRTGTCNVAGSAVQRVSGANFNVLWAPGSSIVVNGVTCTLHSVLSTTVLFLNENAGSGTGVTFTLPQPTIQSQPLQTLWGPDLYGTYFACNDLNNPGTLYWTKPGNADVTVDGNVYQATSGSELLLNGFVWDQQPYVWSSDNLYLIQATVNVLDSLTGATGVTGYMTAVTPCGKGLWTTWAFTPVSPRGIYFLAKDGIYRTQGGSPAQSITDADLYPLFPHEGVAGVAVNGILPPNMATTARLRLSYASGWLYFDYVDMGGTGRTLAYRESDGSWWPDVSTPGIASRYAEPGASVYETLIGGATGLAYTPGGFTDNGTVFTAQWGRVENQGDVRRQKLYRDVVVNADLTSTLATLSLGLSDNSVSLGSISIGGAAGRSTYYDAIDVETGAYGTNLTMLASWSATAVGIPIWYWWDLAYQPGPELATSWLSGPTTHGLKGFQQVAAALLAYSATGAATFSLIIDNVLYTYALPSTGGVYAKNFLWLQAVKGKTFQYGFFGPAFQLFDRDCEVWVQPWGDTGGYQKLSPF